MATTESQQAKADVRDGATLGISGWTEVVKTVRDADAVKVGDAKEDIDNLLVFAGLFSAILTAFLIEAYHALQPDTDSEILFLLHRIATQNYTISSGFLNTSSPFPMRKPFEAPTWAVRVNGLWFASLIFSLAAASLGILVKAWLREYLASQWMSPQEKLRSRQYRYPGLIQWKVFEIAAILPLLLQLALALFFIGLCMFTASIDRRIALTSIPLVSGWAFFLISTTIAPVFNPRCPFKVPGLRRALQSIRRHLLPRLFQLYQFLSLELPKLKSRLSVLIFRFLPHRSFGRHNRLREFISSLRKKLLKPRREASSAAPLLPLTPTASAPLLPLSLQEEDDVVSGARDEAEVLLDADTLISQDSWLPLFFAAFKQTKPTSAQSVQFMLRLMRHRLPTLPDVDSSRSHQLDYIVDLTGLSQRAYTELMLFAVSHIQSIPSTDSLEGVCDILLILLSKSTFPYPAHVPATINAFLTDLHRAGILNTTCNLLGTRCRTFPVFKTAPSAANLPTISSQLVAISIHRQVDVDVAKDQSVFFSLMFYDYALCGSTTAFKWQPYLFGMLCSAGSGLEEDSNARLILGDLWEYLDRTLEALVDVAGAAHASGNTIEALHRAMYLGTQLNRLDEAAHIFRRWLSARWWTYASLALFASTATVASSEGGAFSDTILPICERTWSLAEEDASHTMLENVCVVLRDYTKGIFSHDKWDQLDLVAFTRAYLRMYVLSDKGHLAMWKGLWTYTQVALKKYCDDKAWMPEPTHYRFLLDMPYCSFSTVEDVTRHTDFRRPRQ